MLLEHILDFHSEQSAEAECRRENRAGFVCMNMKLYHIFVIYEDHAVSEREKRFVKLTRRIFADIFGALFHYALRTVEKFYVFTGKFGEICLCRSIMAFAVLRADHGMVTECRKHALKHHDKALAARIDKLWREVDWNFYRQNGQNVLYWHWSPEYGWEMNFPVHGYNECLIMYILAAASPTHGVPAAVYHEGWAQNGAIVDPHKVENIELHLRYQGTEAGPLFWAQYSFLGLDPIGLKDEYCANYFDEMRNLTLVNRAYCVRNPKHYKGFGPDCWGLTASYSVNGYAAHAPNERDDQGVISPTAALSSIVYTPEQSLQVMRHLYEMGDKVFGPYGFYDAFSETDNWYPQRYLAIDQGPIAVMLENYRSGLLWKLFMSHPDVQKGLKELGFSTSKQHTILQ